MCKERQYIYTHTLTDDDTDTILPASEKGDRKKNKQTEGKGKESNKNILLSDFIFI